MPDDYAEQNLVQNTTSIKDCYLCGLPLTGDVKLDHVIPNSMFKKGSPSRPKLPVHHECNNKKSKDDEWFLRQMNLMCGLNPEAFQDLEKLLKKAEGQKQNAYIIGKSREVREYKLATSLLAKNTWGLQVKMGGETFHLLNIGKENCARTSKYVKQLCRGLYILNVPGSNPSTSPKLSGMQFAVAQKDGKYEAFKDSVVRLIQSSNTSGFGQEWPGRVIYHGSRVVESPDKGYLYIEFYGEVGYLVAFGLG